MSHRPSILHLCCHNSQLTKNVAHSFRLQRLLQQPVGTTRSYASVAARDQRPAKHRDSSIKRIKPTKHDLRTGTGRPGVVQEFHEQLQNAARSSDPKNAFAAYEKLPKVKNLSRTEFLMLAQCIHQGIRKARVRGPAYDTEAVAMFVNHSRRLIKDVKDGLLVPSFSGFVHLMGALRDAEKYDDGLAFWDWLSSQDDYEAYLNLNVYAAGIDLLTVNGADLSVLENVYQTALERFPGNFVSYHLSPYAIVRDREQLIELPGLPISLLQAITLARLARGSVQQAYLGLDTAFRLLPAQVPSYLVQHFILRRPASEAYAIFVMACRAGIHLHPSTLQKLLNNLSMNPQHASLGSLLLSARSMLSVMRLQFGAGSRVDGSALQEISSAILRILRLPYVEFASVQDRQEIAKFVSSMIKTLLEIFARYGVKPHAAVFNNVILAIGGFGMSPQTAEVVLADMDALSVAPNQNTRRALVAMSGLCRDKDLTRKNWAELTIARLEAQTTPDKVDLQTLIEACNRIQDLDYAEKQFVLYQGSLSQSENSELQALLKQATSEPMQTVSSDMELIPISHFEEALQKLADDLAVLENCTRGRPAVQNLSNEVLPSYLFPANNDVVLPEHQMRELYDEFTTESRIAPGIPSSDRPMRATLERAINVTPDTTEDNTTAPATHEIQDSDEPSLESWKVPLTPIKPALSPTDINFGTLRYETWKGVNTLIKEAELHKTELLKIQTETFNTQQSSPPFRSLGFIRHDLSIRDSDFVGLSTLNSSTHSTDSASAEQVDKVRKEIIRLRSSSDGLSSG